MPVFKMSSCLGSVFLLGKRIVKSKQGQTNLILGRQRFCKNFWVCVHFSSLINSMHLHFVALVCVLLEFRPIVNSHLLYLWVMQANTENCAVSPSSSGCFYSMKFFYYLLSGGCWVMFEALTFNFRVLHAGPRISRGSPKHGYILTDLLPLLSGYVCEEDVGCSARESFFGKMN